MTTATMSQENALRKLVQGEEGREWADERTKGWTTRTTEAVCDWEGISCGTDNEVTSIVLAETDLLASIPSEFALLTALTTLDLRQNLVWGTIPHEMSTSMSSLVMVDLQDNRLEGSVPTFRSSRNLKHLDLSRNVLKGHVPPDFGADNTALAFLDLQKNSLSGYLPYGLEDLPHLETISLSYNSLSGTLPEYLGDMTDLKFLYLNHNHLVGTIPSELGGGNTTGLLKEIWLQNNDLSGTIPPSLADAALSLTDLYLDGNKLTGTVPAALCQVSLNADFFDNKERVNASDFCDSVSCPAGTVSDEGVFPCRPCESTLPHLYLGQKGECDDLTELRIVDMLLGGLATNAAISSCSDFDAGSSSCNACDYEGVTCNSDKKVISIRARGVGLKGTLPDELGLLPFLSELDVADNALTGYFPSGLRFAPLKTLHISGNQIRGIVPPLLCEKASEINGGGDSCTSIACPIGTYSTNGTTGYGECSPCSKETSAPYLGSKECVALDLLIPIPAPTEDAGTEPVLSGLFIGASIITAIVAIAFVYLVNRERRKRLRNWDKGFDIEGDGSASFPHAEEVKTMLSKFNRRGDRDPDKNGSGASGTKWLHNHLNRSYHYVISLTETEDVKDPPGVQSRNVTEGEIDDYGWTERESILRHRDLEVIVEAQKDNATKLEVWEYPDPLERGLSYGGSSDDGDHKTSSIKDCLSNSLDDEFDDDDDLSEWIRKQQDDPDTREVWLDVPRIE